MYVYMCISIAIYIAVRFVWNAFHMSTQLVLYCLFKATPVLQSYAINVVWIIATYT